MTCDADNKWEYSALTARPSSAPADSSSSVLVTGYGYAAGRLDTITDPRGIDSKFTYDDLGRQIKFEEDEGGTNERTTLTQYDGLGNVAKRIADMDNDDATFTGGAWTTDGDDEVTTYTFADGYNARLVTKIQYPDSADSGWDVVAITYHLDGRANTRTSQKAQSGDTANVVTYSYDDLRRMTRQAVTTLGTSVDNSVQSIGYNFDNMGRQEKITSYSDTEAGTAVNEVAYEYNNLGMPSKEYQEHEGVKDGSTLYVQYNYDDTASSGVYTKAMRAKSVRYPNTREVYALYADSGDSSGIGDAISRVTAIATASTRGQSDANVLSAYSDNGAGRLVVENFAQAGVRLDYWGQTADTYVGFDRFGRVIQQLWKTSQGQEVEKYNYGYDYNSDRTYRENNSETLSNGGFDELYAHDNLNRLVSFQRGDLNANKDAIPTDDRTRGQAWGLDAVGNWPVFQTDANGDGDYTDAGDLDQDRTHNLVNEITGISEQADPQQSQWADPAHDARGNMTTVPKPTSLTGTYTCKYDAWNRLAEVESGTNVVARYEYDGLNRRVKKHVDTSAPGAPDGTIDQYEHFFYNGSWQLLETRLSTGENTGPEDLQPRYQYVWSLRYIDAPVCRNENSDADGLCDDGAKYCLTDANMNVTGQFFSSEGKRHYVYDAYGNVSYLNYAWSAYSRSSDDSVILFAGYYYDVETGLYHVRNRSYHPHLGRWVQRDPLGYPDGMNLYEYSRSTVALIDPAGLLSLYAQCELPDFGSHNCVPGYKLTERCADPTNQWIKDPGARFEWMGPEEINLFDIRLYFSGNLIQDPTAGEVISALGRVTSTVVGAEYPLAGIAIDYGTEFVGLTIDEATGASHSTTWRETSSPLSGRGYEFDVQVWHMKSRPYGKQGKRKYDIVQVPWVCECRQSQHGPGNNQYEWIRKVVDSRVVSSEWRSEWYDRGASRLEYIALGLNILWKKSEGHEFPELHMYRATHLELYLPDDPNRL